MTVVIFENGVEVGRQSFSGENVLRDMWSWLRWNEFADLDRFDVRAI